MPVSASTNRVISTGPEACCPTDEVRNARNGILRCSLTLCARKLHPCGFAVSFRSALTAFFPAMPSTGPMHVQIEPDWPLACWPGSIYHASKCEIYLHPRCALDTRIYSHSSSSDLLEDFQATAGLSSFRTMGADNSEQHCDN